MTSARLVRSPGTGVQGKAVANGDPVGAVLGYFIVGMLVRLMMYLLGEVRFLFSRPKLLLTAFLDDGI